MRKETGRRIKEDGMEAILSSGPQIQENGTFMATEEMLDGKQPQGLTALVINKTLAESAEMASRIRVDAMRATGKGNKLDIVA